MSTVDLQIYPTGGYTGTADSSSIRTMRTVFNVPTTIYGVWIQGTTAMGGATSSTGNAIVADANGNVIGRGPATNVNNSGGSYYLPLNSPVAVSAGIDYYIGFGSFSGNNRFNEGLNPTVLTSSTVSGINITVYNTQRIANGDPNTVSSISNVSTNNYIFGIGVRVKVNNAPNTPGIMAPTNGTIINNPNPDLIWSFSDPDGDPQAWYQVQISHDSTFSSVALDTGQVAGSVQSYHVSTDLGDGQWYWRVRVWDSSGAVSPWSQVPWYGLERTAPTYSNPNVSPNPSNAQWGDTHRVSINISDNWSGAYVADAYYSSNSGGSWTQCVSSVQSDGGAGRYIDVPVTSDGTYFVDYYVKDYAGNQCATWPIRLSFVVDHTIPYCSSFTSTQYLNVAPGGTYRVYVYGVGDALSGVKMVNFNVAIKRDGTDDVWYNCVNDGNGQWHKDIPITDHGNVEGVYACDIYIYDNAGNGTFIGTNYTTVDRTVPIISSVQGYSYTNVKTGTRRVWAYGVSDAGSGIMYAQATYQKPGGSRAGLVANKSGSDWYADVPLDGTTEGEWNVQFTATDNAGNVSSPVTAYFFIDTQRANDPNPSASWGQTQVTIDWSGFQDPPPSSGYQNTEIWLGEWDGTNWVGGNPNIYNGTVVDTTATLTEKTITGLTPGKRYRYTVAYYDKAGNESAFTWRDFVTKKKIGEVHLEVPTGIISLPVYDPSSGVNSSALRIKTSSTTACFELVATSDTNASTVHINTASGVRAISKFGGT